MKCATSVILLALALGGAAAGEAVRSCEPIRVAMCRNLGYNHTGMPNLARHTLQADADVTLQTFAPLVQYGCSEQLHLFLCAVYVPMCTDQVPAPIGPCRGLCEAVHARCYPLLRGFGFPWPAELECARFPPANNHQHMCMEGPRAAGGACRRRRGRGWRWVRGAGRCVPECEGEAAWGAAARGAAAVWLGTWAALGAAAALAGLAAAGGAPRPLVLLALCRAAAAAGWAVRAAAGRSAAGCAPDPAEPTQLLLAYDGLANPNCAVVFILLYYFGLAASVWWVVLAGVWRATVLRPPPAPGPARADRHSSLLQLAAWGIPAALTAAVLVTREVDADELTATCFVGNQSSKSLLALVIIPEAVCLLLGCVFLCSGLRAALARPATPAPPALLAPAPARDQAALRLGAFAALYAVPSACILATYVYEWARRDAWTAAPPPGAPDPPEPPLWLFLFRIFAAQTLGVLVAVWVAAPRLKALWRRALGPRKPQPPKGPPPPPLTMQCYAHAHTLPRHAPFQPYRHASHGSYRKPRHYHYSAGETIL